MADAGRRRLALLARLRHEGARVTACRVAVLDALLEADAHLTAEQIAESARVAAPDVHRSTVYRALDALEQLGMVDHVHLGHGPAVYHLADEAHQHLVCEACGDVVEVPDGLFEDLAARLRRRYGFAIRPNHFAVLGRCRACR